MNRRRFFDFLLRFGLGYSLVGGFGRLPMNGKGDKALSLFLSHGPPDLVLRDCPARDFMRRLGNQLPKPRAILVISAHWMTLTPMVSIAAKPDTIYDFGGFDPQMYQLRYPAPGAPDLARRVVSVLGEAGISTGVDSDRGLDHGAWVPLMLIWPHASIPVLQLSIQPRNSPQSHFRMGRALAGLRDEGVMIVSSGGITHNLREATFNEPHQEPPAWVTTFNDWVHHAVTTGKRDELLEYLDTHPHGAKNHPTPDHLLPLFTALGAGDGPQVAQRLHHSYLHGVLSMDAYVL